MAIQVSVAVSAAMRRCVCAPLRFQELSFLNKQGTRQDTSSPGNEAGDVSGDMEMGRHFRVPALLTRETKEMVLGTLCASVPFLLLTLFYSNGAIRKSRPQATNWKFNFLF